MDEIHIVKSFGGIMANFAERIKALRLDNGMTQAALGKVIGVRQDAISVYESGQHYPEMRNLIILADFFGVSIDYLVGRTDNPEINR